MSSINRAILNNRFKEVYFELERRGEIVKNSREKSKAAFAESIGTKGHIIDKYLRDERKITYEQVKKLCFRFGVSEEYMFQGKGICFPSKKPLPNPEQRLADMLNIPSPNILFTNIEAFASNTVSVELWEENQRFHIPGIMGDLVAFNINGESMAPTIRSGDMVICKPLEEVSTMRDQSIYAVVTSTAVWVKRVQRCFDRFGRWTHIKLISDNKDEFDPFLVEVGEIRKLLKVTKKLTGLSDVDWS